MLIVELIESTMYLYQATGDPQMLHIGATVIESIDSIAKTECGYAVIHDVTNHKLSNRMESFFLAETTKYLYLLFDHDNFVHNDGSHGTVVNTARGECVIDSSGYVFNTEAHLIDMAVLDCCAQPPTEQFSRVMNDLDLLNVFDPAGSLEMRAKNAKANEFEEVDAHQSIDLDPEDKTQTQDGKAMELLLTCKIEPFFSQFSLYGETAVLK